MIDERGGGLFRVLGVIIQSLETARRYLLHRGSSKAQVGVAV
jgi:hypothetical protein